MAKSRKTEETPKKKSYKIKADKKLPLGTSHVVTNDGRGESLKLTLAIAERLITRGFGDDLEKA